MIFLKLQNTSSSFQFPPQWEKIERGECQFSTHSVHFSTPFTNEESEKMGHFSYILVIMPAWSFPSLECLLTTWVGAKAHTHTNPHPWGRQENCDAGAERKKGAYVTEVATRRCSARFRKYSIQSQSLFTFTHKVELKDAYAVGMNRSEIRASDVGRIWKKVERKSVQIRYSILKMYFNSCPALLRFVVSCRLVFISF